MDPNHRTLAKVEHGQVPERMHPLVAAAMAGGTLEPATLRELLAVQREWEAGEARKAFSRAFVALKAQMPSILKHDKVVDFTGKTGNRTHYTHTSLAGALDSIEPHLTAHGFSLTWEPSRTDRGEVQVTARLAHSEGHAETCTLSAPVDTSGSKSPAQGVASTITLLQRYTALSLLGIATREHTEPTPSDEVTRSPARVDADRNLRAVAKLAKHGRTASDAEAFLGRPVSAWTSSDLDRLREWVQTEQRQPGEDDQ